MSAEDLAKGVWDMDKSENFDDYMKALGVGMATRLIGNKVKPSQHISIDNGEWTIKTVSTFKNTEVKFKLGVPFKETTVDGREVETTYSVDGNKLIQEQKGTPTCTSVREFANDAFTMTLKVNDVTATRYYKKAAA